MIINLLENINKLSMLLLFLCSFFYYWHLKKTKRERKLSSFEFSMFIIIKLAYFLWAGSYLLLFLDRNFG
ncbi:hypothetical protein COM55_21600 [Bacillus pseudomycoides]|nr:MULTISPECIES: hypothetical protein [Bacillus cereus group]PEK58822.1 hypothetical protein CN590_25750 [Bacillus pseudomycoides]PGE83123.1 hypothetical protein COM55_21600 [Bacillus pseudomycoides]